MIDGPKIKAMVEHWLKTPPNGYFGQGYGADVRNMLLRELSSDNADALIKKLRRDIPLIAQLDDSQVSISTTTRGHDQVYVYLFIGNITIDLGGPNTQTSNQDYYDVRAQ